MPDLKIKIGLIGKFDMLKFKNMKKVREQAIQAAPAKEVKGEFAINTNAKKLHPDYVSLVVDEVIDHGAANAKTFVFKSKDGKALPYFRAGMYLSLKLNIDGSETTRAYSLCSSPKKALQGKYAIAVRANPNGFVADKLLANLKVGDEVIGNQTRVKIVKNKVAPPFRKAEFDIMFGEGISRSGELVDMGVELGIIKKSGSFFSYNGTKIAQGRDATKQIMLDNPELAEEIETAIVAKLKANPDSLEDAEPNEGED